MVRNRRDSHNYSGDNSPCVYYCLPCIGCFFAGEKILESICVGILWVCSCGGGYLCKKRRRREVIPRNNNVNVNEEELYDISVQQDISLEIESIEDEEMKDAC